MKTRDLVLKALSDGAQGLQEVHDATGGNKVTLGAALKKLRAEGLVDMSDATTGALAEKREYSLTEEGASKAAELPDLPPPNARKPHRKPPKGDVGDSTQDQEDEQLPLSGDEEKFKVLLKDSGVDRALGVITEMFFDGDTEDLGFLWQVLEDAKSYVRPGARKMVMAYWAQYIKTSIPRELQERMNLDDAPPGNQRDDKEEYVSDIGWKTLKDKAGDWVPRPGGDLTYKDALRWSATMNATKNERESVSEDGADHSPVEANGAEPVPSFTESIMLRLLDKMFTEKEPEKDDGKDEQLRLLREQLEQMREDRHQDQLTQVKSELEDKMMATNQELAGMIRELRTQSGVTDNSPTVQLVKDASDKFERSVDRLAGVGERVLLKTQGGEAEPEEEEETSPDEDEKRAGELLDRMDQNAQSRKLRVELFGR